VLLNNSASSNLTDTPVDVAGFTTERIAVADSAAIRDYSTSYDVTNCGLS